MTERIEGNFDNDSVWLQVPDGYVRERGILFGALGPPSVVPFDPALHLPKAQVMPLAFLSCFDHPFLTMCHSIIFKYVCVLTSS